MSKLILTSTGFDNNIIQKKFQSVLSGKLKLIKAVFIPTAAITDEQKKFVPLCMAELVESGISRENITIYDLGEMDTALLLESFNAVYVCGGDTRHLVNEMLRTEFNKELNRFLSNGGVYIGVSAGSIALTKSFEGCLGYVNCELRVHCQSGSPTGLLDLSVFSTIDLTDNQALVVDDETTSIIE